MNLIINHQATPSYNKTVEVALEAGRFHGLTLDKPRVAHANMTTDEAREFARQIIAAADAADSF